MRIYVIRIVALLWLSGTFYVSFLLFSTKTSINHINWNEGVSAVIASRPSTDEGHGARFDLETSVHLETSNASSGWQIYKKYKDTGSRIWPVEGDTDDRILNQIHATPRVDKSEPPKVIFFRWGLSQELPGREQFLKDECPVNWCTLTDDKEFESSADLIFYKDSASPLSSLANFRNPNQVSLLFRLESPTHSSTVKFEVNWTATYRTDAVLNAPYEKFAYFKNFTGISSKPARNFAEGKTKKVAWFVSNCWTSNKRLTYAEQLSRYIQVDIYGSCGRLVCSRDASDECMQMLKRDYKFYLSFENSNCRDYITEKFFINALSNDILPIVMGAHPDDYKKLAPPGSYIHVDDFDSPMALAKYLHKLDKDDDLYNRYFLWKGAGELIDTKFWCRLCALLHERERRNFTFWYKDVDLWFNGPSICLQSVETNKDWYSWREFERQQLKRKFTKTSNSQRH